MTDQTIAYLCSVDKSLARVIRKAGPCTLQPDHAQSPFEALVEAVTYQQLSGKAAATILGRVKALYPKRKFPRPQDLLGTDDDALRRAGLSRAKTASVKDISAKTLAGVVPTHRAILRLSDDEIIERLTTIRGVGTWTVQMLLIFKLGRPDVLPATDYGVRKGFALTYRLKDLPPPAHILEHGERWRPHRTTAAWYLWRALDK